MFENLSDLLSTGRHTEDFNASRSEYINDRVRLLALLFSVAVVFWIPIDYLTLSPETFTQMAYIRLVAAILYLALALWHPRPDAIILTQIRLLMMVLIPTLLFALGETLLSNSDSKLVETIYSFYPFIIIIQLAIFPLALVEGLLLMVIPFAAITLLSMPLSESVWGTLWLLSLTAMLSCWAQLSQLHMLLRLYRQATRDPLTCLFNRRVLLDRMETEINAARRYGRSLSIMLFDLDKFKYVNDSYGHQTGDEVLKRFSAVLTKSLRTVDIVGRYGGEEFLAVLPATDAKGAQEVADRIRLACHEEKMTSKGEEFTFTTSVGVAEIHDLEETSALINRADEALYSAKDSGRDRVVIAPQPQLATATE